MIGGRDAAEPDTGGGALGTDRVQPSGAKPLLGPVLQIDPAGLGQFVDQVAQRRVAEFVGGNVGFNPGQEHLVAQVGDQLFQYSGTFGIGDPVEVVERGPSVLQRV